jgi:hypothetical protein
MGKRCLLAGALDRPYSWAALSNFLDDPDSRWKRSARALDALSVMELNERKGTPDEKPRRRHVRPNREAELGGVPISQNDYGMKPHILKAVFSRFRQRPFRIAALRTPD